MQQPKPKLKKLTIPIAGIEKSLHPTINYYIKNVAGKTRVKRFFTNDADSREGYLLTVEFYDDK